MIVYPNRLVQIALYSLKRLYGRPATIRILRSQDVNFVTGVRDADYDEMLIKKAVLLPTAVSRDFDYDLAYLAAANNYTYGALFDRNVRVAFIDGRDFTIEASADMNTFILFGENEFHVKKMEYDDIGNVWWFTLENLEAYTDEPENAT